jgi:ribosome-binding protein aMBF1 (putative translation factor)
MSNLNPLSDLLNRIEEADEEERLAKQKLSEAQQALVSVRTQYGVSQSDLAHHMKKAQPYVSRIENGATNATSGTLRSFYTAISEIAATTDTEGSKDGNNQEGPAS